MKKYYLSFLLVLIVALAAVGFLSFNAIKNYLSELRSTISNIDTPEIVSQPVLSGKYEYKSKNGINIQIGSFDINLFKSNLDSLSTAQEVSLKNNDQVVVNGGYFTETKAYIGLLWNGTEKLGSLSVGNQQATHVAHFNKTTKELNFISSLEFEDSDYIPDANNIYFQAGPLIVNNNEIQTPLIDRSLNGNQSAVRTFVGFTESGKIFTGVTTQVYDLRSLASQLVSKDFFDGEKISVLNLDGGSSTSLYSNENPAISFRYFKQLPYFVEFK
ncbi:MAG: phosphodiester glycosidase family protein [Candidatus Dojkabacteria bacterium]